MDEIAKATAEISALEAEVEKAQKVFTDVKSKAKKREKGGGKGALKDATTALKAAQAALDNAKENLQTLKVDQETHARKKRSASDAGGPILKKGRAGASTGHESEESSLTDPDESAVEEQSHGGLAVTGKDEDEVANVTVVEGNAKADVAPVPDGKSAVAEEDPEADVAPVPDGKSAVAEENTEADVAPVSDGKSAVAEENTEADVAPVSDGKSAVAEEDAEADVALVSNGKSAVAEQDVEADVELVLKGGSVVTGDHAEADVTAAPGGGSVNAKEDAGNGMDVDATIAPYAAIAGASSAAISGDKVIVADPALLAMDELPNEEAQEDEEEDEENDKSKGKKHSKEGKKKKVKESPLNTYENLSDEDRARIPMKARKAFRAFLRSGRPVNAGIRRMIRENQTLVPESATISRALALHILTSTRKNVQCLYHHKTKAESKPNGFSAGSPFLISGTPGPRLTGPDDEDPKPGLLACGCEEEAALWDFIFWKMWKISISGQNGGSQAEGMSSQLLDPRSRLFMIEALRRSTGLILDNLYTGPGDLTAPADSDFPEYRGPEHQKTLLQLTIMTLMQQLQLLKAMIGEAPVHPNDMNFFAQMVQGGVVGQGGQEQEQQTIDPTLMQM